MRLEREGEKRDHRALDEIAARKHAVVLWCLRRARIGKSISHGVRALRGRFPTAWSLAPQHRLTGGKTSGSMNLVAKTRVQSREPKGVHQMEFTGTACSLVSLGVAGTALAADPFYVGSWTFTTAVVAPWADPHRKPDDIERALMGKAVVVKVREISGPRPFACAKPQYKVTEYGPDMNHPGRLRRDAAYRQEGRSEGDCRAPRFHGRHDQDARDRLRDRRSFRRPYNGRCRTQQLRVYAEEALVRVRQCPFTSET